VPHTPSRLDRPRLVTFGDDAQTSNLTRAAEPYGDGEGGGVGLGADTRIRDAAARGIAETDQSHPFVRASSRRSNSVAVVITEPTVRLFADPFFSTLLKGIHDALAERSMLMALLTPQSAREMAMAQCYLLANHADGAILASLHGDNQLPNRLREAGIPTVVCGTPARGIVASYVDSDNRQGATMAVQHLISLGRRKIATISGNLDMTTAVERQQGYRDALVTAGIPLEPTLEEVADYLPNRAHMAMERLLLNHPDVDAVFAASDLMAASAIRVLHQARKRIPEDVAVVGFDDSPTARTTRPSLTSIRQPIEEIGREAVNILLREMQEPEKTTRKFIFATDLVARESTIGAEAAGTAD
jgi:DNA-binding LacI/PurR family transcriptional regulator